jgi:glycosyltransferase involved in cell wall biosynthesis
MRASGIWKMSEIVERSSAPAKMDQRLCILLCIRNGAKFLEQQLRSIEIDLFQSVLFIVSDDSSTDSGLDIVKRVLKDRRISFILLQGPNRGFAENFRSAILSAALDFDFFAFCDQDDIWHRDKLPAAISAIRGYPLNLPIGYGSRTTLTDEKNAKIGMSPIFARPTSFQNALVQSIAGGNTIVLNRLAFVLLKSACANNQFVAHDWFAYQMVTGAGGVFIMDPVSYIDYRQHAQNTIGSNVGIIATVRRLASGLSGQFSRWNDTNIALLDNNRHLLTSEAVAIVEFYKSARSTGLISRLKALLQSGVYRQTLRGNVSLWIACLLKRL